MSDNEIIKIIETRIKEAVDIETERIKEKTDELGRDAVNRINGVYTSVLNTIKGLDIKEPSLIEFYTRAGGRVRTIDLANTDERARELYLNYQGSLIASHAGSPYPRNDDPIILQPKKRYRILIMAMEEGDA